MTKTKDKAPEERIYFFDESGDQIDGFLFLPARGLNEPLSEDLYELMKGTLTELITGSPKSKTYPLMMEALKGGRYGITPDEDGADAYWYYGDDKGEDSEPEVMEEETTVEEAEEQSQESQAPQTAIERKMAIEAELDAAVTELSSLEEEIISLNEIIRELEVKAEKAKGRIATLTEEIGSLESDLNKEKELIAAQLKEALSQVEMLKNLAAKLGIA